MTSALLSSTLASYATTAALSAAIADFLVEDDVTTLLSDYVDKRLADRHAEHVCVAIVE